MGGVVGGAVLAVAAVLLLRRRRRAKQRMSPFIAEASTTLDPAPDDMCGFSKVLGNLEGGALGPDKERESCKKGEALGVGRGGPVQVQCKRVVLLVVVSRSPPARHASYHPTLLPPSRLRLPAASGPWHSRMLHHVSHLFTRAGSASTQPSTQPPPSPLSDGANGGAPAAPAAAGAAAAAAHPPEKLPSGGAVATRGSSLLSYQNDSVLLSSCNGFLAVEPVLSGRPRPSGDDFLEAGIPHISDWEIQPEGERAEGGGPAAGVCGSRAALFESAGVGCATGEEGGLGSERAVVGGRGPGGGHPSWKWVLLDLEAQRRHRAVARGKRACAVCCCPSHSCLDTLPPARLHPPTHAQRLST